MEPIVRQARFTNFAQATAEDWALIASERKQAGGRNVLVPGYILEQLEHMEDPGFQGWPVTRLEHSLQTATRAEKDGRDVEYVLCALLHDLGENLAPGFNHGAIGAAVIKPFVSEANHWMVENHNVFQGYYFWHHIGRDRDARERFRGSPYFEYTVEFCAKYDNSAVDADYKSEPLEHFAPMIRSHFGTAPSMENDPYASRDAASART